MSCEWKMIYKSILIVVVVDVVVVVVFIASGSKWIYYDSVDSVVISSAPTGRINRSKQK